jgi:hypothetical protein
MDGSESVIETESEALSRLRTENATLALQRDNAQLAAEIRRLRRLDPPESPWWKNRATMATLTVLLAAVVLLNAAVHGWFQKSRALALEELKLKAATSLDRQQQTNALALQKEKQVEAIRESYVERLKEPSDRLRALRFVLATIDDSRLRSWAAAEKPLMEEDLRKLDEESRRKLVAARPATTASPRKASVGSEGVLRAMVDMQQVRSQSPAKPSQKRRQKSPEEPQPEWEPAAL